MERVLDPSEPIEELFDHLETCHALALSAKPAYTQDQIIDKALMAVQSTGLYLTAILEWNGFDPANQIWAEFKSHFVEACDICLQSGAGTTDIYHGVENACDATDNDSIGSIMQRLTSVIIGNRENWPQKYT